MKLMAARLTSYIFTELFDTFTKFYLSAFYLDILV